MQTGEALCFFEISKISFQIKTTATITNICTTENKTQRLHFKFNKMSISLKNGSIVFQYH